jgi:hypothetical protein
MEDEDEIATRYPIPSPRKRTLGSVARSSPGRQIHLNFRFNLKLSHLLRGKVTEL